MTFGSSRRLWALALALISLSFVAAGPAEAQKKRTPPPQISAFEMEPLERLEPGGEMFFRLQGTAGGRATVRVTGVSRTIVLQEVDDGTYEGGYTLRKVDRPTMRSSVTGLLRKNGLAATSRIQLAAPAVAAAPPPAPPVQTVPLAIQRFSAAQVDRFEPGTELRFAIDGTPGQRASFSIEGIGSVPMREIRPGHYEGSYTLKREDRIAGIPVVALLQSPSGAWVKSELRSRQLLARAPREDPAQTIARLPIEWTSHQPNATVPSGRLAVRGRTAPGATVDVEVTGLASVAGAIGVTNKVYNERVVADADGNFGFEFTPQAFIGGTRYEIDARATAAGQTRESKLVLFAQR